MVGKPRCGYLDRQREPTRTNPIVRFGSGENVCWQAKKLQDAEALAEEIGLKCLHSFGPTVLSFFVSGPDFMSQDLRMRLDAASEAKIQAEIQKEVEKGSFGIILPDLALQRGNGGETGR